MFSHTAAKPDIVTDIILCRPYDCLPRIFPFMLHPFVVSPSQLQHFTIALQQMLIITLRDMCHKTEICASCLDMFVHRLQEVGLRPRANEDARYEPGLRSAERKVAIMQATRKETVKDRVPQVRKC